MKIKYIGHKKVATIALPLGKRGKWVKERLHFKPGDIADVDDATGKAIIEANTKHIPGREVSAYELDLLAKGDPCIKKWGNDYMRTFNYIEVVEEKPKAAPKVEPKAEEPQEQTQQPRRGRPRKE